jgi:hypothetical protein
MLQAHSLLWYYLWLAPTTYGVVLALCLWHRGIHRQHPFFFAYLVFDCVAQFTLCGLDLSRSVSAIAWWQAFWTVTIIEGLLKFAILAELLHHLLQSWPSIAKVVRNLVAGAGVVLVLLAAVAAAFAAPDNTHWLVGGAHILLETLYFAQAGLIISIFLLAHFFHIPWERKSFGIALGFAVAWCEHLAVWALVAGGLARNQNWVDFANMATYHASVLIWYYFLLVPKKIPQPPILPPKDPPDDSSAGPSAGTSQHHEEDLENWNRELERLIHQ